MQNISSNGPPVFKTDGFPLACYYVDDAFWNVWTAHRPFHWHKEVEIVHILSGTVTFLIGEENIHAKAGDVLFVNSGIMHGPVERNGIYFSIVYDTTTLLGSTAYVKSIVDSFDIDSKAILSMFPREDQVLHDIIDKLVGKLLYGISGHELFILSSLFSFYNRIQEMGYYHETDLEKKIPVVKQLTRMKNVLSFIEEHYMEQIGVEDMALEAGLHPKYLSRVFKGVINKSPTEYLKEFRVEQACKLLLDTNLPITEVAFQCGFNDSSYFVSVFKQLKGITPLQYRKSDFSTLISNGKNVS